MYNKYQMPTKQVLEEVGLSDLLEYLKSAVENLTISQENNRKYSEIMFTNHIQDLVNIIEKKIYHLQKTLDNYKTVE